MLKGKNVVIVKGEKGTPSTIEEYERVYLENASTDKLEAFGKTTEGKDLEFEGKKWEGLRPVEGQNNPTDPAFQERVSTLLTEALNYFSEKFPKVNNYITLLEAASYGADLWERNRIQAAIRPSKPMDQSAAIAKMAKLLMAMNPKLSLEKATAAATAANTAANAANA